MADRQHHAVALGGLSDPAAILFVGRHGLFKQNVVAQLGKGQRRLDMHRVLGRNNHRIGKARTGSEFAPIGHGVFHGEIVFFRDALAMNRTRLGHAHNPRQIGPLNSILGITRTAPPGTNNQQRNRSHIPPQARLTSKN
jgi:hypothetical protein